MAAVSISAQNTRLDDAEATTDWGDIGGGTGAGLETDFLYQNSNCIARKGATSARGFYLSDNVNTDISTSTGTYQTVMFKAICTTPGLLESQATPGWFLSIGSGSTTSTQSSDYYTYEVHGNDTYPIDRSWLIVPIDPNIASHRDSTTGTPDLTNADYFALEYDQTGQSKSPNQGLDAVDVGAGLTLTGGDAGDADGVWQDFSDADWGTANNRWGYVQENNGIFSIYGMMNIGSATATVFNDSDQTVIFPDGLFAAGFSGITVDLQNATNDVDFASIIYKGLGSETGEDTRPTFTVTSTSGSFDADLCTLDTFASVTFTSACTWTDGTISNSGLVTLAEADISGTSVLTSTVAADEGAVFDDRTTTAATDLTEYTGCTFSQGTNAHHAIRFGTGVDDNLTLTNVAFNGFSGTDDVNGSTFRFDATSGSLTLNLINCTVDGSAATTSNIGVDDAAGITVTLNIDPVTTLVNVKDDDGNNLEDANVYLRAADGAGDLPFEESVTSITRSGTTATVTHTAHGMNSNEYIKLQGITDKTEDNNGAHQITVTGANTYTYTTTDSGSTNYTGTITATGVTIYGLTDASGNISSSRTYGSDQNLTGYIRKSTSSPRFKSFTLTPTVDSSNGVTVNVRMILDE
mgnify:CR=1 FL=1